MKSQNTLEEWRPIDGYPNYQVSNRGRVLNVKKNKVLKPKVSVYGYECVCLSKDGKPKSCFVHRLVANAFIPNPNNLPQVNHISEDKRDNNATNLEWVTPSQNIRHSAHQHSCRVNQLTLDGEFIKEWESFNEIERETDFDKSSINMCCKGKRKTCGGYKWSYASPLRQKKYNRRVAALTKDGDLIAEYKSATDAGRCLKINHTQIYLCLYGTIKSVHGLRFIYID